MAEECIRQDCVGKYRKMTDEEHNEVFGEEPEMTYYKCKRCGEITAGDVIAEMQMEREARKRQMRQRERRVEGW